MNSIQKDLSELQRCEQRLAEMTSSGDLGRLLVVIDEVSARVYTTTNPGSVPVVIRLDAAADPTRHLRPVERVSAGPSRLELRHFLSAIIAALWDAHSILLLGSSEGGAGAMLLLIAELKLNHPALASRLLAHRVLDQQHLTEDQLLAAAREFYASHVNTGTDDVTLTKAVKTTAATVAV